MPWRLRCSQYRRIEYMAIKLLYQHMPVKVSGVQSAISLAKVGLMLFVNVPNFAFRDQLRFESLQRVNFF